MAMSAREYVRQLSPTRQLTNTSNTSRSTKLPKCPSTPIPKSLSKSASNSIKPTRSRSFTDKRDETQAIRSLWFDLQGKRPADSYHSLVSPPSFKPPLLKMPTDMNLHQDRVLLERCKSFKNMGGAQQEQLGFPKLNEEDMSNLTKITNDKVIVGGVLCNRTNRSQRIPTAKHYTSFTRTRPAEIEKGNQFDAKARHFVPLPQLFQKVQSSNNRYESKRDVIEWMGQLLKKPQDRPKLTNPVKVEIDINGEEYVPVQGSTLSQFQSTRKIFGKKRNYVVNPDWFSENCHENNKQQLLTFGLG